MDGRDHEIGRLYVAGDHACELGDLRTLADIAERLVEPLHEPLHCELLPLVQACTDAQRATSAWTRLKDTLETAEPS